MTLAKSKILKSPLRNSCLETNINIHKNIVYKMYEKIWIRYLFFFKNKFLKNKVWTKVRVFEAEGRQDTTSVSTPSFFREYFSPPSPPPPAFNQYSLSHPLPVLLYYFPREERLNLTLSLPPYPHLSPSFILHYLSFSSYLLSRVTSVTFYLGQYSIAKKDSPPFSLPDLMLSFLSPLLTPLSLLFICFFTF